MNFSAKTVLCLASLLPLPQVGLCAEPDWSVGVYGGQYYDSEPAGFVHGNANFLNQYIVAITGSRTLWRSATLPLSLELDGMIGQQWGQASLSEIAVAPVLGWSGFPWNSVVQTALRFGPVGVSYTDSVSPLERGEGGEGTKTLNFLMAELGFSRPESKTDEIFLRLHHRCAIYDLLNKYGANGEDFFALGYRRRF